MNQKIKVLAVRLFGGLIVIAAVYRTQPTSAQTRTETAGQKYKNIKVLNELPAEQLGRVMNIMSASLGVDCKMCHVSNERDFEKDDIDHKDIARKMIRMTMDLNKNSFDGKSEISCNTCHNGNERPTAVPSLYPPPAVERPKQPATLPTIDQLLEKYAAALGAKDAASRGVARHIVATRVEPNGTTTEPEDIWQKGVKSVITTMYGKYLIAEAFDGEKAWKRSNNDPITLNADEAEQIKRDAAVFGNPDLRSIYTRMDVRNLDRIDGRDVYFVLASTKNNQRERLYFDAQSGFLVRRVASTQTPIGQFQYQVDFSDFKDFSGAKLPTTIKFAVPNVRWTRRIVEVANEKVDDSKFTEPPAKS